MKPEKLWALRIKLREDFDKYMNDPEVEDKYKSPEFFLDNRYEVKQGMTYGNVVDHYLSFINEKFGWNFYYTRPVVNKDGTKDLHNWMTGSIVPVPAELFECENKEEDEEYEEE